MSSKVWTEVIILQFINVSKQHLVHMKLTQLCANYISVTLGAGISREQLQRDQAQGPSECNLLRRHPCKASLGAAFDRWRDKGATCLSVPSGEVAEPPTPTLVIAQLNCILDAGKRFCCPILGVWSLWANSFVLPFSWTSGKVGRCSVNTGVRLTCVYFPSTFS